MNAKTVVKKNKGPGTLFLFLGTVSTLFIFIMAVSGCERLGRAILGIVKPEEASDVTIEIEVPEGEASVYPEIKLNTCYIRNLTVNKEDPFYDDTLVITTGIVCVTDIIRGYARFKNFYTDAKGCMFIANYTSSGKIPSVEFRNAVISDKPLSYYVQKAKEPCKKEILSE